MYIDSELSIDSATDDFEGLQSLSPGIIQQLQEVERNNDNTSFTSYQRYISMDEILKNASVIRYDYYADLPFKFVKYSYGNQICNSKIKSIPTTTDTVRKRNFLTANPTDPTWESFMAKKRFFPVNYFIIRSESPASELLKTKWNWYYGENLCLDNNTNLVHIYTENYDHFLHLNNTIRNLVIPSDRSNFRYTLRFVPHYGSIPKDRHILDNMYVIINRGWNNMYHHSEWIIQIVRYLLLSNTFPSMNNIIQFPDIDWINHHTRDRKGHYRYGRGYLDLVMDSFQKDINKNDVFPRLFEGIEYRKEGGIICSKQGLIVPIITDMIKCFIDKKEAYHIRMLAYKRYHVPLPIEKPSKLHLRYVDRKTDDRGIKNQDEIMSILVHNNGTVLKVQVNQALSFSEQVVSMFPVDILVSVHGAGLTNILFMLPFSALIEIFPPMFHPPYYRAISRSSDLIYHCIKDTKIVNKNDYAYIRSNLELTNKVFYVSPERLSAILSQTVNEVWVKKYTMVKCII